MQNKLTARVLNRKCPYVTSDEISWLKNWAAEVACHDCWEVPSVVIIGAGPGVMPIALLETGYKFNLWVIEIDTFQWLDAHMEQAGLSGDKRLIRIHGDSYAVGRGWLAWLDLLIIDGDHSYEGVSRDIKAWMLGEYCNVRAGGYVWFHDFGGNLQGESTGVKQAVEEFVDPVVWNPVVDIGISRIFRRIK